MTQLFRYRCKGRSLSVPGRIIRLTVTAKDPDDARAMARLRCPDFGTTVETPRRYGLVVEPEQADPVTQAKAREFVEFRGTLVEVVD